MKTSSLLLCAAMGLGCSYQSQPRSAQRTAPPPPPLATATTPPVMAAPAAAPALTPASAVGPARPTMGFVPIDSRRDKPESHQDVESILEIRQLLAADTTLSPAARNITIVARDGRIWLRGSVSTAHERAASERSARKAVHVIDVRNELSVME
jgi:hypothetical protein